VSSARPIQGAGEELLRLDGRRVPITSASKLIWPRFAYTKGQMVDYYLRVAPALLAHLEGRPLTLGRFPDGVEESGFAQTECRGRPPWLRTLAVATRDAGTRHHCLVEDRASLAWVANQNAVELHHPLSRGERTDLADTLLIDLDPGSPAGLRESLEAALLTQGLLGESELKCWLKTSGAAGVHVLVPLGNPVPFAETKRFARGLAERLARERPDLLTDRTPRAERAGKVLADWLGNERGRTVACAYSLRAMPWPAVSVPLEWGEVEDALAGDRPPEERLPMLPGDVLARVEERSDPAAPLLGLEQRLPG
jgi:bifunctional non-homologous end joining protein LigD